jgi:hypothetical protein
MSYDYEIEPHEPGDSLTASITAEVLRCIAHSLTARAKQLDQQGHQRPKAPETTQSKPYDDRYDF